MDYSQFLTPEQAQQFAATEDPEMAFLALKGQQNRANSMYAEPLQTNRSVNGVAGRINPMEVLGNVATNAAGAYMQKDLNKQYADILGRNNQARGDYAKTLADALRRQGTTPYTGSEFNMMNPEG